jgi:hypothetical protein
MEVTRGYAFGIRSGGLICVALLASLAGCGGSGGSKRHSAATPGHTAAPNGVAQESGNEIVRSVVGALAHVRSFHLAGMQVDARSGPMTLTGDVALPGRLRIKLAHGNQVAALIAVNRTVYLIANTAYWSAHVKRAAIVSLLANRWILLPPAVSNSDFGSLLAFSSQRTFAKCFIGRHGALTVGRVTVLAHRRVVILKDKGDVPGDSPGEAYIAATGPPLPLRIVQTGPEKPGGTPNVACGESGGHPDTTTSSDLRLTRFNVPVRIVPPKNPIVLPGQGTAA